MDVVEFVRNMRYLKVLLKMMFSQREHQIMWRLRSINLHDQLQILDNAAGQNSGLIGDLMNFRLSGIQKVSQDYIN